MNAYEGNKNIFIGYKAGMSYSEENRHDRRDPFSVNTYVEGDYMTVSSEGFRRKIKRKDSWWDKFRGITWESKVRQAQKDAFMEAYKINMIK